MARPTRIKRNVNGKVPAGTLTFNEMYPKGSPERLAVEARLESLTGVDFFTTCCRADSEMKSLREEEAVAKVARKEAAIKAAAK